MHNLKVLIVEDEKLIANDIKGLLVDWGYTVAGCAANSMDAMSIFKSEQPDLAIVDVQLQGEMDGIELVKNFNTIQRIPIIYLTSQGDSKTVERAKITHPAAYLLKPFNARNLSISLELAFSNFLKDIPPQLETLKESVYANEVKLSADVILKKDDDFFIKQSYRFVKLKLSDLLYVEADRNHSFLVMKHQRYIIRMPLAEVVERLNDYSLVRIHRSYAINIQHVDEFNDNEVLLNGKTFPITSVYRVDFLKKFNVI